MLMKTFALVMLLTCPITTVFAEISYASLNKPLLNISLENMIFEKDDVFGEIIKCKKTTIKDCVVFNNSVLVRPILTERKNGTALSIKINERYKLLVFPWETKVEVLGVSIKVIKIQVLEKPINKFNSFIYLNSKQGIVAFSINGINYYSQSKNGLFNRL